MSLVIVGLGNPGKEYETTRHNAGRVAVERIAKHAGLEEFKENNAAKALVTKGTVGEVRAVLVLPETMMNLSGKSLPSFVKSVKAAKNLLVIHDDLDLPLGTVKMVVGRGSGGHKGVESIMRAIKTKGFMRIRIGISPKKKGPAFAAATPGKEEKVIKMVIGKWKPSEEAAFKKVLKKVVETVDLLASEGVESAMQFANTR